MPSRSGAWASAALTSVPEACPAAGCHDHTRRFVDHQHIVVLEDHLERDVLPDHDGGRCFRDCDGDALTAGQAQPGLGSDDAIDADAASANQGLKPSA